MSTVETFPLVFSNLTTTAANTLTLRPQTGATNLLITSADTTAASVDLNGAQFLTIDGRPGGVGSNAGSGGGSASQLTIGNTNTSGVAVRFINEAIGNTLQYISFRGVNPSATSGVVVFSTTTGANGNDQNTLDHCDIRDGVTFPANGVYSLGTASILAQNNSGNIVSNCNVYNFQSGTLRDAAGVRFDGGNTDWTIIGNSFYQTSTRTAVAANVRPIYVNAPSGNNFMVIGNFIGGSSPNAAGTAWTASGTANAYLFQGIYINVGTITPSSVHGNTIKSILWASSSSATALPGVWSGIYVRAGTVNVGTVTGNTIGSGTGTGSISVTTSGTGGTSFGITSASSSTVTIANNTIGSITVNGTTSTISASLTGIQATAGVNTISNNTVGSTITANSFNAVTSSISAIGQQVTGILSSGGGGASITGNTVANLNNNSTQTTAGAGQIRGMVTSVGVNTITGNTVSNLSTTSGNPDKDTVQSVVGIMDTSTSPGQTVSQNTVHSLANTAPTETVGVVGIYFAGPTNGTNIIARNWVHSLTVFSSNSYSELNGMFFAVGMFTARNNMVRVGLKADGTSTAHASAVRGIFDNGNTEGRNFYHNSVYLGGTQTSGANSTLAFFSIGTSNARTFQNNLFVNARSNSGSTSKHYAVFYYGSTANPYGLTAGGNIFYAPNRFSGGVLGFYNSSDRTTLAAWQAATGQDATSAVTDPLFLNPTGTAAMVDLHLQSSNPAEGDGIPLTDAVTKALVIVGDDFDGQARSTLTPADIGADAGNFTWIDGRAPSVSYSLITNGTIANRVLSGWATITDNSGRVSGGGSAPRLYFKRSADADAFNVANDTTGNGWKYVTATGSGPYSFTIDYSLINGGSVALGDTIQYFVVAQDAANNLGSNPSFATASANPPVQSVNGHGTVNSFSIVSSVNGVKTVGTGGDYPSLSGAGGLFAALNGVVLTGNLVVNIISDLTETGGVRLNQWLEEGVGNYTLTIQPGSATMRTISGSASARNAWAGLITFNGADRVTIDGRFGGGGRYLTFRNTSTAIHVSTILLQNDSNDNIIRSCVVEGGSSSGGVGVIGFGSGAATGNYNNLITACQVRDLTSAAGVPFASIGSSGTNAAANSGNTISNNDVFNFNEAGIYIASEGNDSWTISGNNIYKEKTTSSSTEGIVMRGGGTNAITGNYIHDLLTASDQSISIYFTDSSTTTISGNRITVINLSPTMTTLYGIYAIGSANSTLNQIGFRKASTRIETNSEQDGGGQPATRSESK